MEHKASFSAEMDVISGLLETEESKLSSYKTYVGYVLIYIFNYTHLN